MLKTLALLGLLNTIYTISMEKYTKKIVKKLQEDNSITWQYTSKLPKKWRKMTKDEWMSIYAPLEIIKVSKIEDLVNQIQDQSHINDDVPQAYDFTQQYPSCAGPIMNQGQCGCCWMYSSISAMSSRYCQSTNNGAFIQFSPVPLLTCDNSGGNFPGCTGQQMQVAYQKAQSMGLVSQDCAPFRTDIFTSCGPFLCNNCGNTSCKIYHSCPVCHDFQSCQSKSIPYNPVYLKSYNQIPLSEQMYMKELSSNGPFSVQFTVYSDFQTYKGGIYSPSATATPGGAHAVKMVGYGVQNGVKFWRIQNSWGAQWGENGFFRIVRGQNTCQIESQSAVEGFF